MGEGEETWEEVPWQEGRMTIADDCTNKPQLPDCKISACQNTRPKQCEVWHWGSKKSIAQYMMGAGDWLRSYSCEKQLSVGSTTSFTQAINMMGPAKMLTQSWASLVFLVHAGTSPSVPCGTHKGWPQMVLFLSGCYHLGGPPQNWNLSRKLSEKHTIEWRIDGEETATLPNLWRAMSYKVDLFWARTSWWETQGRRASLPWGIIQPWN